MKKRRRHKKMSRIIKMTQEYLNECRADFEKALSFTKISDGKLSFTKTFSNTNRKATVYFTPEAWAKMLMLVNGFDKEVAWHGVAHRLGEMEGEEPPAGTDCGYVITDILVYPQQVSAAAVEMDTEQYATWLMENAEDERFDHIRMQGHSHVRMSPTASPVDLNHQEEILNMLGDDDFYIFMIWNKMLDRTSKIYDMKENTLFENADISIKILDASGDLGVFVKDAKAMVKDRVSTCQSQQRPPYSGVVSRGAAYGPYNPISALPPRDDSKKETEKPRTRIGAGWYRRNAACPAWDDDDDDNPYNWSMK